MATAKKVEATKYSVAELIAAGPTVFKVRPEIMVGALYGKTEATKEEAEKAVQAFLKAPAVMQEKKGAAN